MAWPTVAPGSVAASAPALVRADSAAARLDRALVPAGRLARAVHDQVARLVRAERVRVVRDRVVRLVRAGRLAREERDGRRVRRALAEVDDQPGRLVLVARRVRLAVRRAGAVADIRLVAAVIRQAAVAAGEVAENFCPLP
jgi:hypothetical protein